MDFPGLLVAWHAGRAQGLSTLSLQLHQGSKDHNKRAAWLGAESSRALGAFTVWESGELEVEVHDLQQGVRTLVVSTVVTTPAELYAKIAAFVGACQDR